MYMKIELYGSIGCDTSRYFIWNDRHNIDEAIKKYSYEICVEKNPTEFFGTLKEIEVTEKWNPDKDIDCICYFIVSFIFQYTDCNANGFIKECTEEEYIEALLK